MINIRLDNLLQVIIDEVRTDAIDFTSLEKIDTDVVKRLSAVLICFKFSKELCAKLNNLVNRRLGFVADLILHFHQDYSQEHGFFKNFTFIFDKTFRS